MLEILEPQTPAEQLAAARVAERLADRRAAAVLAAERRYVLPGTLWGPRPLPYTIAKKWTAYGVDGCLGNHSALQLVPAAERHSWLCWDCTERIRRDLLTLAGCWGFLADLLQRGPGSQSEGGGSSDVDAAAPLDLEIAEIRRTVAAWCWSLIEHMLEDRPAMSPPEDTETPALLRWAAAWHVPYIATHPDSSFPAAMVAEIADMVARVRARLFPDGIRRQRVPARCSRPIDPVDDPGPCGGQLWALLRDGTDPRGSSITCQADPSHEIPQAEWLGLLKTKQRGKA
jgi:hypothetical protein